MDSNDKQMIEALRDGLHGLHLARMALVAESKALRLAGRKTEREKVWARVEELTAQIETTNRELAEHMLRAEDAAALRAELMPCPFCGGVAKHSFGMDEHWCCCTVCWARGKMTNTRQHAVDAWNTRTANLPDSR